MWTRATGRAESTGSPAVIGSPIAPHIPQNDEDSELRTRIRRKKRLLVWMIGATIAAAMGALQWNAMEHSRATRLAYADCALANEKLEAARQYIGSGNYRAARAALDAVEPLLTRYPLLADLRAEHSRLLDTPEVRLGAAGYVRVDGFWLSPDVAIAWRDARARDDPLLGELLGKARTALAMHRYAEGQSLCDQAMTIIEQHPVKSHPMVPIIRELRAVLGPKLLEQEMTAKGYVLYDGRWMSPGEKQRLEQQARGMVEHAGKWVTKEEKFALDQQAKGLVLHDGRWVLTEEKMKAQGYIRHEGRWVRAADREAATTQAADAMQRSIFDDEQARGRLGEKARRLKEEKHAKEASYTASQEFLKKLVDPSRTLAFAPFDGPDVSVAAQDGWYEVLAVVTVVSPDSTTKLRYFCRLRRASTENWQAEVTCFVRD